MSGKHVFRGTVEVPQAKTNKEAVNLGQVKDLVNRYNKEPVRVATTAELTGTYTTGVLTLDSALTTLDGVTLAENDAVLVKDQADKTQNGIYVIDSTGNTLTRREDFEEGKVIYKKKTVSDTTLCAEHRIIANHRKKPKYCDPEEASFGQHKNK